MFTYELQRRLAPLGTTAAVAADPGASNTELSRNPPALRAAIDGAVGGQYYGPGGRGEVRGF